MLYVLISILVLAVIVLSLRLRIRVRLDGQNRLLFFGLGRSGPELDFVTMTGVFKLFGFRLKTFTLEREEKEEPEEAKKPKKEEIEEKRDKKAEVKKKESLRVRSKRAIFEVVKDSVKPLWNYAVGLLKSLVIEEVRGEVQAGFDSPDVTGQVFGYYQAAIGAVPALAGRAVYTPDWTGRSLSGNFRASVALPLYKLVFRTLQLTFSLPLRKIVKLAIGTKESKIDKGGQDV